MKVVAFNGSPRKEGNTWHALKLVTAELEAAGIATEIVTIGDQAVRGCIACGMCAKNKDEKCVLPGDEVNAWIVAHLEDNSTTTTGKSAWHPFRLVNATAA